MTTNGRPLLVLTACVSIALGSGRLVAQGNVLDGLGTTLADAREHVFSSFMSGIPWMSGEASVFKAATPDQRALFVRGLIAVARTFTESAEFAARYARFREAQRPQAAPVAQTGDEALAAQEQAVADAIREAQAAAAEMPPEMRKMLEDNIATMRQQMAELRSDPAHRAAVDEAVKADAQRAEAEMTQRMAAFEEKYPADVRALVASRLRQFLEVCGGVNYAAELRQGKDRKFRFVDPALEQKPAEWKLCYRAGQPAVEAARAAAQEWLAVLGR